MEIPTKLQQNLKKIKNLIETKNNTSTLVLKKLKNEMFKQVEKLKEKNVSTSFIVALESYIYFLYSKFTSVSPEEKLNILSSTYEKTKQFALTAECLVLYLRIINTLAYCLYQGKKNNDSLTLLEVNESVYCKINGKVKYLDPDLFFLPATVNTVEKLITRNLLLQASLYYKENMLFKFLTYYHRGLKRKLEMNDGDPVEWIEKSLKFSSILTTEKELKNAYIYLMVTNYILGNVMKVSKSIKLDTLKVKLAHCWSKYGLRRFELSKQAMLEEYLSDNSVFDMNNDIKVKDRGDSPRKHTHTPLTDRFKFVCTFPSMPLNEDNINEESKLIVSAIEAQKLFEFTYRWLIEAKSYYNVHKYPVHYASCVLRFNDLYRHLAFFEKDINKQYDAQKCRVTILDIMYSTLNNFKCDVPDLITLKIDIVRELSEVQLEMMSLNLRRMWEMQPQAKKPGEKKQQPASKISTEEEIDLSILDDPSILKRLEAVEYLKDKRASPELHLNLESEIDLLNSMGDEDKKH